MSMAPLLQQMGILMLIVCLGYGLMKLDIIDRLTKRKMTKLLLYVTSPALTIDAFCDNVVSPEAARLSDIMPWVFLTATAMFLGLAMVAYPVNKILRTSRREQGLYMMMTVFGNIGFMGFPVISAVCVSLFGEGTDAVGLFYGAIFCSIFNVLVYTLGVFLMHWGTEGGESIGKAISPKRLLTPGVIACGIGIVIFLVKVRLPQVLTGTLNSLGGLTGPLAMLLVGANLAEMPIKDLFTDVRVILYTVLRQFAIPLLAWQLIRLAIPMDTGIWQQLAVVTLVMVGMPVANMASLFATEYGGNEALAARTIFWTTAVSLASIPFVIWVCL